MYQSVEEVRLVWDDNGFRLSKHVTLPEYQVVAGGHDYRNCSKNYGRIGKFYKIDFSRSQWIAIISR